jgi:predicted RNase H-like HicB family nuclease
MKYLVAFEKSETGYGAYAPDLSGCVAAAKTLEETEQLMSEAMQLHVDAMREDGLPVPMPRATVFFVDVPAR